MNSDVFDEKNYRNLLLKGGDDAALNAVKGFSEFGFRKNQLVITELASTRLDYGKETTFAAIRYAHSSRHITRFLEGRRTWLPVLHTAHLFRFYHPRDVHDARGGSLTVSQLNMELLEAFDRGVWSRASGIAKEMALRGENELLLSAVRSEALRRLSSKTGAYTVWNAVRCLASSDTELLSEAIDTAIVALSTGDISESYLAARKFMSAEHLVPEKLADGADLLDETEEGRLLEAVRSGIPEIAVQFVGKLLRKGISLQHLLKYVAIEALRQSFNSERKGLFDTQIESLGSILEANALESLVSAYTPLELLISVAETTSLASGRRFRRRSGKVRTLEEATGMMEKGRSEQMLAHIDEARNMQEAEKIASALALSSLNCDPETVNDHLFVHCSASLYSGGFDSTLDALKIALMECADFISYSRSKRKTCVRNIVNLVEPQKSVNGESDES